jgi:hypothetical protein
VEPHPLEVRESRQLGAVVLAGEQDFDPPEPLEAKEGSQRAERAEGDQHEPVAVALLVDAKAGGGLEAERLARGRQPEALEGRRRQAHRQQAGPAEIELADLIARPAEGLDQRPMLEVLDQPGVVALEVELGQRAEGVEGAPAGRGGRHAQPGDAGSHGLRRLVGSDRDLDRVVKARAGALVTAAVRLWQAAPAPLG